MILVTWNCHRGPFEKKVPLLSALNPDLAVIQECARPVEESNSCLWFGDNPKQSIAIVSKPPYILSRIPALEDVPKYAIPVAVGGPLPFTILAVWSKARQLHNYVAAVVRAIHMYRELIEAGPTVVIGDLNSNRIWDKRRPPDRNHSALVATLEGMNIISAYHTFYDEPQGSETRATYYFRWNKTRPYHIDYCFIPSAWRVNLTRVEVASYEGWELASDHRPLVVELEKLGA
jgi:Endonuclease/Exonuclease/phosphatase family